MQVKEDEASAFILSLRQDAESSIPLGVDPALLLAAKTGKGPLSPAFLSACQATMDVPLRRCAVVAANNSLMQVRLLHPTVPACNTFSFRSGLPGLHSIPLCNCEVQCLCLHIAISMHDTPQKWLQCAAQAVRSFAKGRLLLLWGMIVILLIALCVHVHRC